MKRKLHAVIITSLTLALIASAATPTPARHRSPRPSPSATPSLTQYGTSADGVALDWDKALPAGIDKPKVVLTVSSGHWVDENLWKSDMRAAILKAGFAHIHLYHHLAPGCDCKVPGSICAPCTPKASKGQFPDQTNDLKMAIDAAAQDVHLGGIAGIVGGSGGANLAAFAAAKGWVPCAVLFSPATDLPTLVNIDKGVPGQKAANYAPTLQQQKDASPALFIVKGVSVPTMNVAFSQDYMPASQFKAWNDAMSAAGVENDPHLLAGVGHSYQGRSFVDWIGFIKAHQVAAKPVK